jgi:G3E family GTPase
MTDEVAIQLSLLTGFLGSGKTTLLNALLKHPDMGETAVLVNEFGDIGIDHLLVETVDESVVQLTTGCLCCTIQGDLQRALRELFIKRVKGKVPAFKRVLVETTGLADPAPILHTLINDPIIATRYFLDGVIATVDALHGIGQIERHEECRKQIAVADRVVMTKTDLGNNPDMDRLQSTLTRMNPGAELIRSENGNVDPAALFNCGLYNPATKSFDVKNWLKEEAYRSDNKHAHGHDPNRHGNDIEAFCMRREEPVDWPVFASWIQTLITHRGENLLRIKGIVNISDEEQPIAIHGVQHVFHPPVRLPAWPDDDHATRVVFITRGLETGVIERSLDALQKASGNLTQ